MLQDSATQRVSGSARLAALPPGSLLGALLSTCPLGPGWSPREAPGFSAEALLVAVPTPRFSDALTAGSQLPSAWPLALDARGLPGTGAEFLHPPSVSFFGSQVPVPFPIPARPLNPA